MNNLLLSLQLHLFAAPARLGSLAGEDRQRELLQLSPQEISQQLMRVTFEMVADHLQLFERMFFEMDGSFVWTGEVRLDTNSLDTRWQLDGMVYDVSDHVQRMELKGRCPPSSWRELLHTLDWPNQSLLAYDYGRSRFVDIKCVEQDCEWAS